MVELLPVQQFDPQEGNYWGYMTLNFFAPHRRVRGGSRACPRRVPRDGQVPSTRRASRSSSTSSTTTRPRRGPDGPTYSFRGIDNAAYYVMSDDPRATCTATTPDAATRWLAPASASWTLILESLRYWVTEMHVDGFRFDLASVLARDPDGSFETADTSLLAAIRTDPILRHVHLIAEPWDAGWAYQLGTRVPRAVVVSVERSVPRRRPPLRPRRSRDGRGPHAPALRQRRPVPRQPPRLPAGLSRPSTTSPATTASRSTTPSPTTRSRNWPNGHGNTDGTADNLSWNCGWEGDEDVPAAVMALRKRQAKNLFCLLLLANGVPDARRRR